MNNIRKIPQISNNSNNSEIALILSNDIIFPWIVRKLFPIMNMFLILISITVKFKKYDDNKILLLIFIYKYIN